MPEGKHVSAVRCHKASSRNVVQAIESRPSNGGSHRLGGHAYLQPPSDREYELPFLGLLDHQSARGNALRIPALLVEEISVPVRSLHGPHRIGLIEHGRRFLVSPHSRFLKLTHC